MKPNNNLFLICLLVFSLKNITLFSQSEPTNNWEKRLSGATGQERVDLLLMQSENLAKEDLIMADSLANEGILLASRLGDSLSMYKLKVNLGIIYYQLKERDKSIDLIQESLNHFTQNNLDFEKAKHQLTLANLFIEKEDYAKADSLISESESYFSDIKNFLWQSKILRTKGYKEVYKRDYKKALGYYSDALVLCKDGEDTHHVANLTMNLGLSKKQLGLYPEALELFFQVTSMECSSLLKAKNYALISEVYIAIKDWESAAKNIKRSIDLKKRVGLEGSLAYSYYSMGDINLQEMNYGEALKYYKQSLVISKKYNIKRKIGDILGALGNVYNELNEPEKANYYYEEQLNLAKASNHWEGVYLVHYNRGYFAFKAERFEKALQHLLNSYEIVEKKGNIYRLVENNAMLANVYDKLGNVKKAKFHGEQYYLFKDSITSLKKIKKIGALEQKHLSEKSHSLNSTEQKNELSNNLMTAIALSLFVFLLVLSFAFFKKNNKNETVSLEKESLEETKLDQYFEELFRLLNQNQTTSKKTQTTPSDKIAAPINNMAEFLKTNLSTPNDWGAFEQYFEKIHKDFFKNLKTTYPTITTNELNMCALLKLNLSNKDIAQIMVVSHDSIRKTQSRLSKKMEIPVNENLRSIILKI